MAVIYQPSGRAREYADWAANPYKGCSHKCSYCYVPDVVRTSPGKFHADPQPRKGFIDQFAKDAKRLAAKGIEGPVHLAFTCDPCQAIEAEHGLTRQACEILVEHGLRACILTKGRYEIAKPAMEVLAADPRGAGRHWWGITLTSLGEGPEFSADPISWEPGAGSSADRSIMLTAARSGGLRRWVSLEPVIYPDHTIKAIWQTNILVDHYAVGKLNHFTLAQVRRWAPAAKPVDWPGFRLQVSELLKALGYTQSDRNLPPGQGKTFYIKESLRRA